MPGLTTVTHPALQLEEASRTNSWRKLAASPPAGPTVSLYLVLFAASVLMSSYIYIYIYLVYSQATRDLPVCWPTLRAYRSVNGGPGQNLLLVADWLVNGRPGQNLILVADWSVSGGPGQNLLLADWSVNGGPGQNLLLADCSVNGGPGKNLLVADWSVAIELGNVVLNMVIGKELYSDTLTELFLTEITKFERNFWNDTLQCKYMSRVPRFGNETITTSTQGPLTTIHESARDLTFHSQCVAKKCVLQYL